MPVEQNKAPGQQAFIIGLGALVIAAGVIFLFTRLGSTNTSSNLADIANKSERFAGQTDALIKGMKERSRPKPVSDPTGGYNSFYVYHTGDDPQKGWKAYSMVIDASRKDCLAVWQPDQQHFAPRLQDSEQIFSEPCGTQTYGPEGKGLRQLDVRVEQNEVLVNIDTIEKLSTQATS